MLVLKLIKSYLLKALVERQDEIIDQLNKKIDIPKIGENDERLDRHGPPLSHLF